MNNLKGKKILVVAAGRPQLSLIKQAKDFGITVVSTDKNPEAPGFYISDYHATVDITDLKGTLEIAKKYEIDAVVTDQSDIAVPTVAYVAEELGLRGIGINVAKKATNKFLMKEVCRDAGIPIAKFDKVNSLACALKSAEKIGYPVILKPVDNQGSRGVYLIKTPSELKKYFKITLAKSKGKSILIEEAIKGIETTVEGFVIENKPNVLAISEKKHLPPPHRISKHILYAPSFKKRILERIKEMNNATVKAIGIPYGITHGEFIVSGEEPILIEMAARGGGSKISSHVVPAITGVNVTKGLLLNSFGMDFKIERIRNLVALLDFIILPEGKVKNIYGVQKIRKMNGIVDVELELEAGDIVKPVESDPDRHGQFIAVAKTRSELIRLRQEVYNTLKVEIENLKFVHKDQSRCRNTMNRNTVNSS